MYPFSLVYPITLRGRWGTTDDFTILFFHLVLAPVALAELAKFISVYSITLSSQLFFLFLAFCPEESSLLSQKTLRRYQTTLVMIMSSLYYPVAAWIFLRTFSLVTWFLYQKDSNLRWHLISKTCVLFLTFLSRSVTHKHTEIWI